MGTPFLSAKDQPRCWIVICPEPRVRGGGLWARWYREGCVAVGWYPPDWSYEGQGTSPDHINGWTFVRNRLKEIRVGDKVIPFLLRWRIGPVGTVTGVKAADADWNPTVENGNYNEEEAELGRRILVTWEQVGMPPSGMAATVPAAQRPTDSRQPLARHAIEELTAGQFQDLCSVLSNRSNWIDVVPSADPPLLMQFDEIAPREIYIEGGRVAAMVNRFERDPRARKKCICHYGLSCSVCHMTFGESYGETMKDFIHVHHLAPLSGIGTEYQVDPIADLRPVCPNCHAVLHREDPPLSIEQARALLLR